MHVRSKRATSLGRMGVMTRLRCFFVVFFTLLLTIGAVAQIQNGQITGTVTDPSGAAVPNAKVTIINQATNLSVTSNSGSTGVYNAKELPVGSYKITVEASGFKTFTDSNVRLDVGAITHVDVKMTLGEAREVVEVTGQEAVVNTEDSRLTSTIGSAQISNLPLNGRNVFDLMQLSAGAVNVAGTDPQNCRGSVANCLQEGFNGFPFNAVAPNSLRGGYVHTPIHAT